MGKLVEMRVAHLLAFIVGVGFGEVPESLAASERDCGSVRMDQDGGSLHRLPVTKQTGGTCYAESVTTLFDAVRHVEHPGDTRRSAPIYSAFLYGALEGPFEGGGRPDANINGGSPRKTLARLISEGGCSSAYFERTYGGKIPHDYFEAFRKLRVAYDESKFFKDMPLQDRPYSGLEAMAPHYRALDQRTNSRISSARAMTADGGRALACKIPGLDDQRIEVPGLLQILHSGTGREFMEQVLEARIQCPENEKTRLSGKYSLVTRSFDYADQESGILREIHAHLGEAKATPVEFSYCAFGVVNFFRTLFQEIRRLDRKAKYPPDFEVERNVSEERCGAHSSVIIGRKWDSKRGKCEFLVRNSWGNRGKLVEWGKYYDPVATAEDGNYWIDEDQLMRLTTSVSYLKKK